MAQSDISAETGKKEFVHEMFDNIAPRYDVLNRILSAGIDQSWRRRVIKILAEDAPNSILDVATGTADLAILASRINPSRIVGVDIAEAMLEIGKTKVREKSLEHVIQLLPGDAEDLQFEDGEFDAALVAFGVRNFENLELGLSQINRVLKPGGRLLILEFSRPTVFPIRQLYSFYGKRILPRIGKMISGDDRAYTYLPESIEAFPERNDFLDLMSKVGFTKTSFTPLTFGIASIYSGHSHESH